MAKPTPRAMTLRFEDDGQDFLKWDLDADGVVIDCWPCQGRIWIGAHVLSFADLREGQRPTVRLKGERVSARPHAIKHRIASIDLAPGYTPAVLRKVAPFAPHETGA